MAKTFQFDFVINGLVNRNFTGAMSTAQKGLINIGKEGQALKSRLKELDKELYAGQIDFEGYAAKANKAKAQLKALELQQMRLNKAIAARQQLKSAAMEFSGLALGVYAASRPIVGMINVAAEFEETMSRVKAITRASAGEMEQLTAEAKRLGRVTPFTAKQSAEAMTYLGMAGWETSQILKGMPGLLNLALAGKTDLARTADIISDDLTAFGLGAEKAQHMADVFAYTITRTNTNVEMLGETMKYAAPVAHAFGASMEETAALAGLMANGAIKASTAGTALRMGFLRLAGPPKKAAKALDELGISMSDATKEHAEAQAAIKSLGIDMNTAEGQARPMIGIVKELREKLNQLGKQERLDLAQKIFGVHASSAWLNVFDAPAEKFAQLVGEMEKADGASEKFAKTATDNARGALTRLQSATEGVALAIGSVFLPALADAAGGAAHYAGLIGDIAEKHPVFIKTVGAVGVAMAGTALAVKAAGVVYAAYQVAATAATAGTWAFNAALLANPIGLIVVGIAGLVAAGYTLYKNWDTVSASLVKGWAWVKDTAQGVHDWFMSALSQLPEKAGFAVGYVIGWFLQIPNKLMGIIGSLDGVGQSFIDKAKEWGKLGFNGIIDAFLGLPGKLTSLVSNAWESAKSAIGSFTVGFSQGVNSSGANGAAGQVAANAKGGIYSKGAFLTTFAEESPEAAIPIDNSERAKQLWLKTGQMLGLLQHPERNHGTASPSFTVQGIGPDVSPAQTVPDRHGQQLFIHGQMETPGIFGVLQKWLQHPGKNKGKMVSFPVIPKQPASTVDTMAKLSGLAPVIGRAISVAALALSPMAAAASPVSNPAIVNAAANAMAVPAVVQAAQGVENISPLINVAADRKVPAITIPSFPEMPTPKQPEPIGTITRMIQAAPPVPAGIVAPTLPEMFAPRENGNDVDRSGTGTGEPVLSNLFSALRHATAFQNSGVISQLPSMPALQIAGVVHPPELATNRPADNPDLLQRIREFIQSPGDNVTNHDFNITYSPTISPNINITGDTVKQEVMEAIKQATDISYENFQQMLKRYEHERRRTSYS